MERAIAERLVQRLGEEIEKQKFSIRVELGQSILEISDAEHTSFQISVEVVVLEDGVVNPQGFYPLKVTEDIVISKRLFVEDAAEQDFVAFWNQFLKMIPNMATLKIAYPKDIVAYLEESDSGVDRFGGFYREFEVIVAVKVGEFESKSVNEVYFAGLIPEDSFRALWKECVGSIPEA